MFPCLCSLCGQRLLSEGCCAPLHPCDDGRSSDTMAVSSWRPDSPPGAAHTPDWLIHHYGRRTKTPSESRLLLWRRPGPLVPSASAGPTPTAVCGGPTGGFTATVQTSEQALREGSSDDPHAGPEQESDGLDSPGRFQPVQNGPELFRTVQNGPELSPCLRSSALVLQTISHRI